MGFLPCFYNPLQVNSFQKQEIVPLDFEQVEKAVIYSLAIGY